MTIRLMSGINKAIFVSQLKAGLKKLTRVR